MSRSDDTHRVPADSAPRRRKARAHPPGAPSEDPRAEILRRDREDARFAIEWFGTHHICARRNCRRSGRCTDEATTRFPFCFGQYRDTIFATMEFFAAKHGLALRRPAEAGERMPHRGPSLLGALAARGESIEPFRRPTDRRDEDGSGEGEPDAP